MPFGLDNINLSTIGFVCHYIAGQVVVIQVVLTGEIYIYIFFVVVVSLSNQPSVVLHNTCEQKKIIYNLTGEKKNTDVNNIDIIVGCKKHKDHIG